MRKSEKFLPIKELTSKKRQTNKSTTRFDNFKTE